MPALTPTNAGGAKEVTQLDVLTAAQAIEAAAQSLLTAVNAINGKTTAVNTGAIAGTVAVSSVPLATGAATATGQAAIVSALGTPLQAGGSVSVSNFPASQTVAGTVAVSSVPLATGASTAALQTTGNTSLANIDADLGAAADAAASSDTGSFSLIAFVKRSLQNWTSLQAKIPALGQATKSGSVPVTLASDQGNVATSLNALVYTVSTANSSSVQLAAGAPFTGTIESVVNAQAAQVSVVCDQAYTVQIKQFLDLAGTKALPIVTFTRAAGAALNENVSLFGDYFQVIVTNNGGATTTTFQVGVTFGVMNTQPASLTNDGKFPVEAGVPPALATTYNVAGVIAINTVLATLDCSQYRGVSVQCTSMGTAGVVTPEWSNDNTNWQPATIFTVPGVSATTFNAAGLWVVPVMARYLRLRLSTATTAGTTTIVMHQFNDRAQMWLATQPISGTVSITGYPTAAASADAFANPTVTKLDALASLFNGTSWDRFRNNAIVTMGDTGAKTATFNGATQTNYNARGALITLVVSAVSGTTPTCTVQLQVSYDGTNFDNYGPATTALTAAGRISLMVYPGNTSQAAGATPANLTSGATVFQAINMPLPRTWRLVYTIGGTTPSFTFTNAYAAYIL